MPDIKSGHLTPGQIIASVSGASPEAARHLDSCADCRRELEEYRAASEVLTPLRRSAGTGGAANCPSMEDLAGFAGGYGRRNEEIAAHVPDCGRCAAILRESLDDEPDEEKIVPVKPTPFPVRPWWTWAAAALLLISLTASGIWWTSHRRSDPARLLAVAYTEARPFEFRLPDAGYGPVRQQKGSAGIFDKPEALASAEERIRSVFSQKGGPAILALKGRAELLERDFDAAIESFRRALEVSPEDPALLADLGTAYAARAEAEKRNADLGQAMQLFLRVLKRQPENQQALFNLALVYERLWLVDEAAEAWRAVLARKPEDGWRREAEAHLAAVEKIRQEKKKADDGILHDPARFLAAYGAGAAFDPLPYYEVFWMEWLPAAGAGGPAGDAARLIARTFRESFGEHALDESVAGNANGGKGVARLASAMSANRQGRITEALTMSREAARELDAAGLGAGAALARVEIAYALRRAGLNAACLNAATAAVERAGSRYPWLAGSAHLERLACQERLGRANVRAEAERTRAEASRAGLWPVVLRASGFLCDFDAYDGNYAPVWESAPEGLRKYWTSAASLYRAQSFQYALKSAADLAGWREAAVILFRASLRSTHLLGNAELEASNRLRLAGLFHVMGAFDEEIRETRAVDALLDAESNTGNSENHRWEARLYRAEAGVAAGQPLASLAELKSLASNAESKEAYARTRLQQALGEALYASGDWQAASGAWSRAIDLTRERARAQADWAGRIPLLDLAAPSFRHLAAVRLSRGNDASGALAIWRSYRFQPERPRRSVVFALLPDGPVVWSEDEGRVTARRPQVSSAELRRTSETFLGLCARPSSNVAEIHRVGNRLYRWLLSPELRTLSPGPIALSTDGWLAAIPFSALTDDEGRYLVQSRSFVQNYGPEYPVSEEAQITRTAQVLIVSVPSGVAPGHRPLPVLSAAATEASQVAARFEHPVVLRDPPPEEITAHAPVARILHFLGHGWANGGSGALILSPAADGSPRFLAAREIVSQDWSRCQLAVLSACLTAGEERGAVDNQSLVQALLSAGARRVIASRWSVDSEATRALMDELYAELLRGVFASEALSAAAAKVSLNAQWSHPFFWAGFDVFGAADARADLKERNERTAD